MTHPYTSKQYVEALADGKSVVKLGAGERHAIIRPVGNSEYTDIVGSYPFGIVDSQALDEFNESSKLRAVTYVGVTDALENDALALERFDFLRPYKTHFVVDRGGREPLLSKHHCREVKKAKQTCFVREISLNDYLDEWCSLYDNLVAKHDLGSSHRFSRAYFEAISNMSEFITFGAYVGKNLVSAHIWLKHNDVMYSHLAASSQLGYQHGASYCLYWYAIYHSNECALLDLGGVPDNSHNDGLARFKKGFANTTRTNWLCGRILDSDAYNELCLAKGVATKSAQYFPAYRFASH